MLTLSVALLISSLVVFIIAAVGVPSGRFNLIAAGLALAAGAELALRVH